MGLINSISPALHSRAHELKHAFRAAVGIPKHSNHSTPRVEIPAVARSTNNLAQPFSREAVISQTAAYQAPLLARLALNKNIAVSA